MYRPVQGDAELIGAQSPRVAILGPVRAWLGERELAVGPPARRAVLALLALAHPRPVSCEELAAALWGEAGPPSAANVIQTHVKHLRRALEPDRRPRAPSRWLATVGAGYALRLPAAAIDAGCFRRLVSLAADAVRAGAVAEAADRFGAALELWCGAPAADLPALAEHPAVRSIAGEWRRAVVEHCDTLAALGRSASAVPMLVDSVEAHPLDEELRARLVDAYRLAGRRAEAFAAYEAGRRVLAAELGVLPGPALAAAHVALGGSDGVPGSGAGVASGGRSAGDAGSVVPAAGLVPLPRRPVSPVGTVPAQLPAGVVGFTGRAGELAALDRLPDPGDGVVIVAVCGTAGVGKTALAVHWAHRARRCFPDGQLYVDLRGYDEARPMTPAEALGRFLEALGVPAGLVPVDVDGRVSWFRTATADRRMLLVLDNASSVEQVRPLLPGSPSCRVLVTSRDSLAGLVVRHGAVRIEVPRLPRADAVDLLRRLVGARAEAEPDAAAALAEHCARLPLALRVAAELVGSRPSASLAALAAELADRSRRLAALDAGGDARSDVRVVFSWSLQHVSDPAGRMFRLLGRNPGTDVDGHAAAALAGTDLPAAGRLLGELARAHLVDLAGDRYTMHDLLRAYAAALCAGAPVEADAALDRLLDHYLAACARSMDVLYPADRAHRPPVPEPATPTPPIADAAAARSWLDTHRAALAAACGHAATHDRPAVAVRLAAILRRYLEGGHPVEALAMQHDALAAADRCGDDAARVAALTDLGVTERLLGRYPAAADRLRCAAELAHDCGDRAGEARARGNLGILEERTGQHTAAAGQHEEALRLYRAVGDRYGEAAALLNLGNVYSRPAHHDRAVAHLDRALLLFGELGDAAGAASALTNLADCHIALGHHCLAARQLAEALSLFRSLGHRYGQYVALVNLGQVHTRLGRLDLAAAQLREALDGFREDGNRYGEACALNSLGEAQQALGRPEAALALHTEALGVAVETGDRDEQVRARSGIARSTPAGDPDPSSHVQSSASGRS